MGFGADHEKALREAALRSEAEAGYDPAESIAVEYDEFYGEWRRAPLPDAVSE